MSKEELEEKIKNKECVYIPIEYDNAKDNNYVEEIKLTNNYHIGICDEHISLTYIDKNGDSVLEDYIERLFATKEDAQFYLDYNNITKTEKLPFMTWEEFKKNPYFNFIDKKSRLIEVRLNFNKDRIYITNPDYVMTDFDYTKDGFYETYKICKNLFLGE